MTPFYPRLNYVPFGPYEGSYFDSLITYLV